MRLYSFDVGDADTAYEAAVATAVGLMSVQWARQRIVAEVRNTLRGLGGWVHELSFAEIVVKTRARINAGNRRWRGDEGLRFVSGLIEDWWHARHFVPVAQRRA